MNRVLRRSACVLALVLMAAPMAAHADWNQANDEANRQRMMNDMRASDARNDRLNFESQQRATSGYTSSTNSGSSYSGSSDSGYAYTPYQYVPEGPHSVVATYEFTIYKQESEAETIARVRGEAEDGNAQSQFNLGRIYYTGYGVPLDIAEARKWFCAAAKQDHPIAKSQCAGMMYNGQGGPADTTQAMAYLKESAAKGDPYGEALYGFFVIADATRAGKGDQPEPEAVAYLEKAAAQGQAVAQGALGSIVYFYGTHGAVQDVPRAVGYLRQCAAQNIPMCMGMMGMMYVSGQNGVTKDQIEGVRLLKAAAAGGQADAAGVLALLMGGDAFGIRDDAAAFAYAQQAAKGGDVQGEVVLAKFYYFGQGTAKDLVQSARWFKAAAAQGNQESIDALKEDDLAEAAKQL